MASKYSFPVCFMVMFQPASVLHKSEMSSSALNALRVSINKKVFTKKSEFLQCNNLDNFYT